MWFNKIPIFFLYLSLLIIYILIFCVQKYPRRFYRYLNDELGHDMKYYNNFCQEYEKFNSRDSLDKD